MGLVGLLLLLACANVANLAALLALRTSARIGCARGPGRGPRRLIRQLLTESVLLASLGAAPDCFSRDGETLYFFAWFRAAPQRFHSMFIWISAFLPSQSASRFSPEFFLDSRRPTLHAGGFEQRSSRNFAHHFRWPKRLQPRAARQSSGRRASGDFTVASGFRGTIRSQPAKVDLHSAWLRRQPFVDVPDDSSDERLQARRDGPALSTTAREIFDRSRRKRRYHFPKTDLFFNSDSGDEISIVGYTPKNGQKMDAFGIKSAQIISRQSAFLF